MNNVTLSNKAQDKNMSSCILYAYANAEPIPQKCFWKCFRELKNVKQYLIDS